MTSDDFTPREVKAIRRLENLAKTWPKTLMLISASGSLVVVETADYHKDQCISESRSVSIHGIPNDGGDPGSKP